MRLATIASFGLIAATAVTGAAVAQGLCPRQCPPGQHSISTGPKGCVCVPDVPNLPAPSSKLGQAMVSIDRTTYEFAVNAANGHVMYTFWQLGGGGNSWVDLGHPAQGVPAISSPAASAVGNYIFLTVTGSDSRIYLNQGTPPNWVGWR